MRLLLPHIHFQIFVMILLKFCADVNKAGPDGPGSSSDLDCFVLCWNLIFSFHLIFRKQESAALSVIASIVK
jgi:hypothetical protein